MLTEDELVGFDGIDIFLVRTCVYTGPIKLSFDSLDSRCPVFVDFGYRCVVERGVAQRDRGFYEIVVGTAMLNKAVVAGA